MSLIMCETFEEGLELAPPTILKPMVLAAHKSLLGKPAFCVNLKSTNPCEASGRAPDSNDNNSSNNNGHF